MLKIVMSHFLVVLAVKDTPGNMIPDNILKKLHNIGFSALTKEPWRMYIGVFRCGTELFNKSGETAKQSVVFECESSGVKLVSESHPWKGKNTARIIINDKDYAVNNRGINIVVYDMCDLGVCSKRVSELSGRLLYFFTEKGAELISEYLGVTVALQ